jgi:DNA repair protein RadC
MEPTPLKTLKADLLGLDRRLGQVARGIAPDDGHLSTQLRGGIGAIRRDLSQLAQLDEESALRRYLETTDLLAQIASLGGDARRLLFDQPKAIAHYLRRRYGRNDQVVMGALYLDAGNRLIACEEIYRGTLVRAAVEARAILRLALLHSAASLVLWQTRPSGELEPSPQDSHFAERAREAATAVGVRVLDHIIIGRGGKWCSLKRKRRRKGKGKRDGQT